jgi:cell division protein FtsL
VTPTNAPGIVIAHLASPGMARRVYRIFRRPGGETTSVRSIVIALVLAACALTAVCVIRVERQHEVLRLGYKLARASDRVRRLGEQRRALELELATLTAPDRIRRLATDLGMRTVAPDRIRVVTIPPPHEVAAR